MDLDTSITSALLLHDGELDDLRPLLDAIGMSSVERVGNLTDADLERSWDLVISTPSKVVELPSELVARNRVCVADGDSRTLRTMLERADVRFVIVRPVHEEALKQVLTQAIYAGPEHRRSLRRAVGQTVKFKSGWRAEGGVLADLSETGCRLLAAKRLAPGSELTVYVPRRVDSRKTISLRGKVLRTSATNGPDAERHSIHIKFDKLSAKPSIALLEIVERLAEGPAVLRTANTGAGTTGRAATAEAPSRVQSAAPPVSFAATEPDDLDEPVMPIVPDNADEMPGDSEPRGSELRSDPRLVYSAKIIALAQGAARVLTAEDISSGGLRAQGKLDAAVGEELQIAIPMSGDKEPLVVKARVVRNEDGLALAFDELAPESYERLHRQLELLPEVDSSFAKDAEPARIIVPEKS